MLKNFVALGFSTLARLLTGFVLFIFFAKEWGAGSFGKFMYLFSVASLLVLACEFGFSQQILREVGRKPEVASELMGSFLSAKIWLTGVAWLLALVFVLVTGQDLISIATLASLLFGATLLSYIDFLMSCLRALGRFVNETAVTIKGNLIYFAFGMAALYVGGDFMTVALALALARVIHFAITVKEYRRHVHGRGSLRLSPKDAFPVIGRGSAYGIDMAVSTAFVNIDTILISHTLGYAATGIYQAAARFYQGACLLSPIFGSLYLPKLARSTTDKPAFESAFKHLSWGLTLSGVLIAFSFMLIGAYAHLIYTDPSFAPVGRLLPWLGLLIFTRYVASVYGTVLTALGGQSVRVIIYIVSFAVMLALAVPLMRSLGISGMILTLCVAQIVLAFGLAFRIRHYGIRLYGRIASVLLGAVLLSVIYWKIGL